MGFIHHDVFCMHSDTQLIQLLLTVNDVKSSRCSLLPFNASIIQFRCPPLILYASYITDGGWLKNNDRAAYGGERVVYDLYGFQGHRISWACGLID